MFDLNELYLIIAKTSDLTPLY